MPGVFKLVRRRYRDPPVPANGKHKRLVIVESPAKARTIKGYLGDDFVVESSVGHIRDLPERAADIPEEYKKEKWARLGVNVEDEFRPLYIIDPDKKKRVNELKKLLKNADELLLATDEDREGEAIAWHLLEVLKPTIPVRRMVFHEITKDAINRALGETREIDERLVDAQETRRILDRLYGYEVSPVLWKKITRGLSAGRVQSVATRLVVERELERMAFRAASWWDIEAIVRPGVVPGAPRLRRRQAPRARPRLRQRRQAEDRGRAPARRGRRARSRAAARAVAVQRHPRRAEAVLAPPEPAVHDLDAAAGGEPQAPLHRPDDDARRAAPLRERLHHLHAYRLDDAVGVRAHRRAEPGARAVRRRLRARQAAPVRAQGEERAGGARGDPSCRRHVPHAEGRCERAEPRRGRAVRADLDAHDRVADEGRRGADRLASHRRHVVVGREGRVRRVRNGDHVPRLPRRVRGGSRHRRSPTTRSAACRT